MNDVHKIILLRILVLCDLYLTVKLDGGAVGDKNDHLQLAIFLQREKMFRWFIFFAIFNKFYKIIFRKLDFTKKDLNIL